MDSYNDKLKRLCEIVRQDREDLIALCVQLGNIRSPHGEELEVAEAVKDWLQANGIGAWLQKITSTSANVVARLPGTGDGASLLLDAHLDTGPPQPLSSGAIQPMDGAWVEGDVIYGTGVINDKGQLAAFMLAARALRKAGIRLRGDLIIAGVAFETGAASIGSNQGVNWPGEGFGSWWLINRGVTADYALIGETSGFGLVSAECGSVFLEIAIEGRRVYTPRLQREESNNRKRSSIVSVPTVVERFEDWATRYEQNAMIRNGDGYIIPKAQIVAIDASQTRTLIRADVRLLPGANPRMVTRDISSSVCDDISGCSVTPYQWSRGYVAAGAERLITAITEAHEMIVGERPPAPPSAEMSMWRDLNVFNEVGIPSICYGPPRRPESMTDAGNRAMEIDDLVTATEVYALGAAKVCEVEPAGCATAK
jgi:acetylornithine deacetylase/succinyl-diaminopimelate desuccinylase-like protein